MTFANELKPPLDEALEHYGIKGMKWGVRRDQATLDRAAGRKPRKETRKNRNEAAKRRNREAANVRKVVKKLGHPEDAVTVPDNSKYREAMVKFRKADADYKQALADHRENSTSAKIKRASQDPKVRRAASLTLATGAAVGVYFLTGNPAGAAVMGKKVADATYIPVAAQGNMFVNSTFNDPSGTGNSLFNPNAGYPHQIVRVEDQRRR
jgi:hypothetical protein